MHILNGKQLACDKQKALHSLILNKQLHPKIVIIQVGNDPASTLYICNKKKACINVGIEVRHIQLNPSLKQTELIHEIQRCNLDSSIDGILVQLPLPSQIETDKIVETIDPNKDLDGLHPNNLGKLMLENNTGFLPCTPQAIFSLLEESKLDIKKKHVVIVGRSAIVGKPLALLLGQKKGLNATVTIAHSSTPNLPSITKQADILIAACGCPYMIKEDWIKEKSILIDVGISTISDPHSKRGYRIIGDIDPQAIQSKALAYTPVPGGVGPMTVTMLLFNAVQAHLKQKR